MQRSLFSKAGLPGQQNLFADIGVPDSLVGRQWPDSCPECGLSREAGYGDFVCEGCGYGEAPSWDDEAENDARYYPTS